MNVNVHEVSFIATGQRQLSRQLYRIGSVHPPGMPSQFTLHYFTEESPRVSKIPL
jgi:hypothetical protein